MAADPVGTFLPNKWNEGVKRVELLTLKHPSLAKHEKLKFISPGSAPGQDPGSKSVHLGTGDRDRDRARARAWTSRF